MRILFVSGEYPPITDGIGAYVASVAPGLAGLGHSVHVLSCVRGQTPSATVDRGVHVHRRGELRLRGLERVERLTAVTQRVRRAIACRAEMRRLGEQFDVIETPDWM